MAWLSSLVRLVLCLVLVCTLAASGSVAMSALSATEKSAVVQLFELFPSLSLTGVTSEWNQTAIENICDWPGTSNTFTCSAGRVVSVSIDNTWGYPRSDQFDSFSGLTELTQLTISQWGSTDFLGSIKSLLKALADLPSFTSLFINGGIPVQDNVVMSLITNITTLQHLTVLVNPSVAHPDFSRLSALRELDFRSNSFLGDPNMTASLYTVSITALTGLSVDFPITDFAPLSRFVNLESLSMMSSSLPNFTLSQLSVFTSLRELVIRGIESTELDFSVFNSNLKNLTVFNANNAQSIVAWPPAVERIGLLWMPRLASFNGTGSGALPSTVSVVQLQSLTNMPSIPNGFFAAPIAAGNLTSLSIQFFSLLRTLPAELASATTLDTAIIQWNDIGDPEELCHLPTTLKQLYLGGGTAIDATQGSVPLPFPTCFKSFTQLWNVNLGSILNAPTNITLNLPPTVTQLTIRATISNTPINVPTFDSPLFVASFPNLQHLDIFSCDIYGTFPNELKTLTQLTYLHLTGGQFASGTLDPDFFVALNASVDIDVSQNMLFGALPNQFSPTLEKLAVRSNQLTSFADPVESYPRLSELIIGGNPFNYIPSDAGFANFPNLVTFDASSIQNKGLTIPKFWANHSSISSVSLQYSGFSGLLPSEVYSPLLRTIAVDNNRLCGSLPAFQPFAILNTVSFHGNNISGTIPPSWSNASLVLVDVSNNRLTGNLSSLSFSPASQLSLVSLVLDHNDFFGGLPNMSKMAALKSIILNDTLVELCTANPSFAPSMQTVLAANLPNGGSCACKSWYSAYSPSGVNCAPTVPFVPHSAGPTSFSSCGTSSLSIPTFAPCDYSTQPSPMFSCINGVWTATESVTAPIVVSSPVVIVSGNLSAPVTITNPSSSIVVKECVLSSSTTITIVLTPAQIEALERNPSSSRLLLTQLGANCSDSVSNVHISASSSRKTCKKVSASSDVGQSDHASLFVVFKISTINCNLWWIALASVLGGLVVVAIVGFVLVCAVEPLRRKFLPAHLQHSSMKVKVTH